MVGVSEFSDPLTIVAATEPTVPGVPYKHQASIDSIEIRWTEPVSNGGSEITDYAVYWDEGRGTNEFVYIDSTSGY